MGVMKNTDVFGNEATAPEGYRLLESGEKIIKGDLFLRHPADGWKPVKSFGSRFNPDSFWPIARKVSK